MIMQIPLANAAQIFGVTLVGVSTTTGVGLISAGLAFALQQVITCVDGRGRGKRATAAISRGCAEDRVVQR